jgi:hypothetical protein
MPSKVWVWFVLNKLIGGLSRIITRGVVYTRYCHVMVNRKYHNNHHANLKKNKEDEEA